MDEFQAIARSGVQLQWAQSEFEAGPECLVCRQRDWAVLGNSCGHYACQGCWGKWAETQLPCCEAQRRDAGRCLEHSCGESMSVALAKHLDTRSPLLKTFSSQAMVARRRQLRNNPLYPAAVQV